MLRCPHQSVAQDVQPQRELQFFDFNCIATSSFLDSTTTTPSHHVTIRFLLLHSHQVPRGCQDCHRAAAAARGGHEQCPRSDRSTSPIRLLLLLFVHRILQANALNLENQRALLRRLCPRPRYLPFVQGEWLSVHLHGEVHCHVERHQPHLHQPRCPGEQADGW